MNAPADSRSNSATRAALWKRHGWIVTLVAALALVVWDAAQNLQHYTRASATYGIAVRPPEVDLSSPTSFADGVRTVVLPGDAMDGSHWIMQTQQMLATGEWRIRSVDYDNAPDGRSVHWGSPYRWWLGLLAEIDHAISGRPLGSAVEYAALTSNPALLVLLLIGLVPWVAHRFGGIAAAFLPLAMVGTPGFYVLFAANNPDHHGLIQVCVTVCVAALLGGGGGWTQTGTDTTNETAWLPTPAQARRAFTVSAVVGGLGMWVSAAGTIPVFAGVGLGALAGAWLGRNAKGSARYDASLWRRWGIIGCATSLLAYLAEYFPAHLGWRLEVNHPLYALAWLGAGEVLTQVTAALSTGRFKPDRSGWRHGILGLAALAPAFLLIRLGGERVFAVADPFLWSLSHNYVPEGWGLLTVMSLSGFNFTTIAEFLPMLAVPLVAWWLLCGSTPALVRAVVMIPFAAVVVFWLMAFKELRWWTVGFGFLFIVVVLVIAVVDLTERNHRRRWICWLLAIALFTPGLVKAIQTVQANNRLTGTDLLSLAERDLAQSLRQRVGPGPLVVLSAPATTTRMIYFGGASGLGTPYWENLEGMKRAANIFAARSMEEAHKLVIAAGVTHLVFLSWDDFNEPYVRLARGMSAREPLEEHAFAQELIRAPFPPPWLRKLPSHLPEHPYFKEKRILIFEVTDRTRPEDVLARSANHLLYTGQMSSAAALRRILERFPDDLAVQVALARISGQLGDSEAFERTLGRVTQLVDQTASLEPEDRVNLATLFAMSDQPEEARAQLVDALNVFDETALRGLTPGALMNLLALSEQLAVVWPDSRLHEMATNLVPPDGRL